MREKSRRGLSALRHSGAVEVAELQNKSDAEIARMKNKNQLRKKELDGQIAVDKEYRRQKLAEVGTKFFNDKLEDANAEAKIEEDIIQQLRGKKQSIETETSHMIKQAADAGAQAKYMDLTIKDVDRNIQAAEKSRDRNAMMMPILCVAMLGFAVMFNFLQ